MVKPAESFVPYQYPDQNGHFGPYCGRFVSETLTEAMDNLTEAYRRYMQDPEFLAEFERDLSDDGGGPSPL